MKKKNWQRGLALLAALMLLVVTATTIYASTDPVDVVDPAGVTDPLGTTVNTILEGNTLDSLELPSENDPADPPPTTPENGDTTDNTDSNQPPLTVSGDVSVARAPASAPVIAPQSGGIGPQDNGSEPQGPRLIDFVTLNKTVLSQRENGTLKELVPAKPIVLADGMELVVTYNWMIADEHSNSDNESGVASIKAGDYTIFGALPANFPVDESLYNKEYDLRFDGEVIGKVSFNAERQLIITYTDEMANLAGSISITGNIDVTVQIKMGTTQEPGTEVQFSDGSSTYTLLYPGSDDVGSISKNAIEPISADSINWNIDVNTDKKNVTGATVKDTILTGEGYAKHTFKDASDIRVLPLSVTFGANGVTITESSPELTLADSKEAVVPGTTYYIEALDDGGFTVYLGDIGENAYRIVATSHYDYTTMEAGATVKFGNQATLNGGNPDMDSVEAKLPTNSASKTVANGGKPQTDSNGKKYFEWYVMINTVGMKAGAVDFTDELTEGPHLFGDNNTTNFALYKANTLPASTNAHFDRGTNYWNDTSVMGSAQITDGNKLTFTFKDLNTAYLLYARTYVKDGTKPVVDTTVKNAMSYQIGNTTYSDDATGTIPKVVAPSVGKTAGTPNYANSNIPWTVTVKPGDFTNDLKSLTVTDTFEAGASYRKAYHAKDLTFIENTLKVYLVNGGNKTLLPSGDYKYTLTNVNVKTGFTLTVTHKETDKPLTFAKGDTIVIEYDTSYTMGTVSGTNKTTIYGAQFVNTASLSYTTMDGESKNAGSASKTATVYNRTFAFTKAGAFHTYTSAGQTKTDPTQIKWTLTYTAPPKISMDPLTITDALPDGTEYQADSLKVYVVANDSPKTLLTGGYTFTSDTTTPFKITGLDGTKNYIIEFYTNVTTKTDLNDGDTFMNTATLTNEAQKLDVSASATVTLDVSIISKGGQYDYETGMINWSILYNKSGYEFTKGVITDTLGDNQKFVDNSIKIFATDANGKKTGEPLNIPYEFELGAGGTSFTLILKGEHAAKTYVIEFQAKNTAEELKNGYKFTNEVTMVGTFTGQGPGGGGTGTGREITITETGTGEAPVNVSAALTKTGAFKDDSGNVDWTVSYNTKKVNLGNNPVLVDTFGTSPKVKLIEGSIKVYDGSVDEGKLVSNYTIEYTTSQSSTYPANGEMKGFTITFSEQNSKTNYIVTYSTHHTEKIPAIDSSGSTSVNFTNKATLKANPHKIAVEVTASGEAPKTVTAKLDKKDGTYDPQTGYIGWSIEYNTGNTALDAGATLTDTFGSNAMQLVDGSLVVYPKSGNRDDDKLTSGYTLNTDSGKGFVLRFDNPIDTTYVIEYSTTFKPENAVNNNTKFTNTADLTATQHNIEVKHTDKSSATPSYDAKIEKTGVYNLATGRVEWTVKFNTKKALLGKDAVLTDVFSGTEGGFTGMKLVAESLKVYKGLEATGDALTAGFTPHVVDLEKGFDITFADGNEAYTITFSTVPADGATLVNNQTKFKNTATLEAYPFRIKVTAEDKAEVAIKIDPTVKKSVVLKDGVFTWTVLYNTEKYALGKDVIMDDVMSNDPAMTFVDGRLEVYADDSLLTAGSGYEITQGPTGTGFQLKLDDGNAAYRIVYQTTYEGYLQKGTYKNTATFTANPQNIEVKKTDSAQVVVDEDYNKGMVTKGVTPDLKNNDYLDWTIDLNIEGAKITKPILTDFASRGLEVLDGSFKVVATADDGAEYTLDRGTDYTLDSVQNPVADDSDPTKSYGTTTTITFIGNHEKLVGLKTITITYSTRFDASTAMNDKGGDFSSGDTVKVWNSASLNGYEVLGSNETEFTKKNYYISGGVTAVKVDVTLQKMDAETGESLTGAVFNILNNKKQPIPSLSPVSVNDSGQIFLSQIKTGTYYLEEVTPPDGYKTMDDLFQFKVTSPSAGENELKIDVPNDKLYPVRAQKLSLRENDAEGGQPLENTVFELRHAENGDIDNTDEGLITTLITGDDGFTTPYELTAGEYAFVEVTPPEGYELSEPQSIIFTVGYDKDNSGNNAVAVEHDADTNRVSSYTVTFENLLTRFELRVTKQDGATGTPLAGAVFQLTNERTGHTYRATSGADGILAFKNLSYGEHTLVELTAPTDYVADTTPRTINITKNAEGIAEVEGGYLLNYIFNNTSMRFGLRVLKADVDTGDVLAGAVFSITDSDGNYAGSLTTDADGYGTLGNLLPGRYTLTETQAPDGYVLPDRTWTVTLTERNAVDGVVTVAITNVAIDVPPPIALPLVGPLAGGAPPAGPVAVVPGPAPIVPIGGGEAVVIGGGDTPTTNLLPDETPLGGLNAIGWSLLNLIMGVAAFLTSVILFISMFTQKRRKRDEEDENDRQYAAENGEEPEEEEEQTIRRRLLAIRVPAMLLGLVPGILFLLLENIRLPMTWITQWTPIIGAFFILTMIAVLLHFVIKRKVKNEDDSDDEQQKPRPQNA